jgi:hypothetical protein
MKFFTFGILGFCSMSTILTGCGDKTPEEVEELEPSSSEPESTGEPSNSEPGTDEEEIYYLLPAAIGFEYIGNWDEEQDVLVDYIQPGELMESGEDTAILSLVKMSLASADYFSMSSDDPDKEEELCTMYALFFHQSATIVAEEFNWDSGSGGTGTMVAPWAGYEGYLSILEDTQSDRCLELDPDGDVTDAYETFNEMHFGIAFAGLSSYITAAYDEFAAEDADFAAEWETTQYSYFTQYIAVNHPNSNEDSGYDFIGYDWTMGLYIESDKEQCEEIVDANGEVLDTVCGKFGIEAGSEPGSYSYVLDDIYDTTEPRFGYMSGNAWWYEDFPNLDLTMMQEGVPEMGDGE